MFFKRKNVNPEFEKKVEQFSQQESDNTATFPQGGVSESTVAQGLNANEEQEAMVNGAKKILEQELSIKHYFHKQLLETLDLGLLSSLDKERAKVDLHEAIVQLMADDQSHAMSAEGRKRVIKQIEDEVFGLGPLEPLLADKTVSDILVNGPKNVFVERGGKLEKTPYTFLDDRHLRNIIDRIVSQVGRRIDEASPMVDARLVDGSRVNAIIPPLALDGPSVSIRRFAVDSLTMDNLLEYKSSPHKWLSSLKQLSKVNLTS